MSKARIETKGNTNQLQPVPINFAITPRQGMEGDGIIKHQDNKMREESGLGKETTLIVSLPMRTESEASVAAGG